MNEKRNLLITWTPYLFYNSIITQLKWLSKKFNITIGLASYHLSDEYVAIFDSLVSDNMIDRYFIIKTEKGVVSFYNSVKCEVKQLKTKKFDVWLTLSNIHIYEKYVEEFIIPSHCLKVIYSDSISYLLTSPDAYPLIHSSNCVEYDSLVKHDNTTKSVTDKFKVSVNKYGFLMTIQRIFNILYSKYIIYKLRKIEYYYNHFLVCWSVFGKVFPYKRYEQLTQLTSGNVDAILFTDPMEVDLHKKIYSPDIVSVVSHALAGQCKCKDNILHDHSTVLSPLSGVVGVESIPENIMEKYLSGLRITLNESGAKNVHLRVHPRETGQWPDRLCDYLNDNGVPSEVVKSNQPIGEIACLYAGFAGFASSVLRDARAACDYAFIVCFEDLSMMRYTDPKLSYGLGEGIGWINRDMSYDKRIFLRKEYHRPTRPTLSEELDNLLENF